jgi:hypothetical protein
MLYVFCSYIGITLRNIRKNNKNWFTHFFIRKTYSGDDHREVLIIWDPVYNDLRRYAIW